MFDHDQFHDPEFRNLVRAARAVIAERVRRGVATPAVVLHRTVTSIPSRRLTAVTSAHRRALTSLRRIPGMTRSPAITATAVRR